MPKGRVGHLVSVHQGCQCGWGKWLGGENIYLAFTTTTAPTTTPTGSGDGRIQNSRSFSLLSDFEASLDRRLCLKKQNKNTKSQVL